MVEHNSIGEDETIVASPIDELITSIYSDMKAIKAVLNK